MIDSLVITDNYDIFRSYLEQIKENRISELSLTRWNGDSSKRNFLTELLEALVHNSSLTYLNLSTNSISDRECVILAKFLAKNLSLAYLDLSTNTIFEQGAIFIVESLKENKSLTHLNISFNNIDFWIDPLIENLRFNTTLSHISMRGTRADKLPKFLRALKTNKSLTSLELYFDSGMTSSQLAFFELVDLLNGDHNLKSLNISRSKLNTQMSENFAQVLKGNTNLEILNIGSLATDKNGINLIIEALKHNTSLRELDISAIKLDGNQLNGLVEFVKNNHKLIALTVDRVENAENREILEEIDALIHKNIEIQNDIKNINIEIKCKTLLKFPIFDLLGFPKFNDLVASNNRYSEEYTKLYELFNRNDFTRQQIAAYNNLKDLFITAESDREILGVWSKVINIAANKYNWDKSKAQNMINLNYSTNYSLKQEERVYNENEVKVIKVVLFHSLFSEYSNSLVRTIESFIDEIKECLLISADEEGRQNLIELIDSAPLPDRTKTLVSKMLNEVSERKAITLGSFDFSDEADGASEDGVGLFGVSNEQIHYSDCKVE
jgi:hypothetical protein